MTPTLPQLSRGTTLLRRVAIIGALLAITSLGALAVWASVSAQHEVKRMSDSGVQTVGHLGTVLALGQIDSLTNELGGGLRPRPLAELRHARAVLARSVVQMEHGALSDQRGLARFAQARMPVLDREIDDYIAAVRGGIQSEVDAHEKSMQRRLGMLQIRVDDFATDPSRGFKLRAATASEHAQAVHWTALVLIPLGIGFILICGWQLRSYRRRSEAALRSAHQSSERDARTDELTGLPNRRGLLEDLEARIGRDEAFVLVLADLNGFKHYNDTFGHQAGDALLRRLGQKLAERCGSHAVAARLSGDEFCIVAGGDTSTAAAISLAQDALSEHGNEFRITCEAGVVRVPDETRDVVSALRLADTRMYAGKAETRLSVEHGVVHLLLRMLDERHPGLGCHVENVADLATACAEQLDLSPDMTLDIRAAAQLHDIGKVAIPTAIISKPGSLNDSEWDFIKQHTIIGQRVLSAVPTMRRVGEMVRASHERWDGAGYPDESAGEAIPIGARIVSVADAFCAMTEERSYCEPRTREEALEELRRCAGSQFDPDVVAVFREVLEKRAAAEAQLLERKSVSTAPLQPS
jgi:diguanylate cyclase (GGDEF)-like protein